MDNPLRPRTALMHDLAEYVVDDPWMCLWALRKACEALDLHALHQLVEAVDQQDARDHEAVSSLLMQLVRERFGR